MKSKPPDATQPTQIISDLRTQIDVIDETLLSLLNQRATLAKRIGEAKSALQVSAPFHVPSREKAIVERLVTLNAGPFPSAALQPVFQEIFSACLSLEKGLRIAFLGPEGTFSHEAVKQHFGLSARVVPCGTVPDVFGAVERGHADYGVVPVENATEGLVDPTLERFLSSSLVISAEIVLAVRHCLCVRPGVALSEIQRVYSHPMALGQCRNWLQANLSHAALVEANSTADAVRLAREDAQGAAVSSTLAASLWGMEVLRASIQDFAQNATRFFVLGNVKAPPSGADCTSVLVTLKDGPGALLGLLQPLAERKINLYRIESRPTRSKVWDYAFFLDLAGHQTDALVAEALNEMERHCASLRLLGSYPTRLASLT